MMVILNGSLSDEQILDISRRQPVVATGRRLEGRNLKTLRLDNEQGGYMAASHLLNLGHRRIAHISGPEDHEDAVDRYAGFVRAHKEYERCSSIRASSSRATSSRPAASSP